MNALRKSILSVNKNKSYCASTCIPMKALLILLFHTSQISCLIVLVQADKQNVA